MIWFLTWLAYTEKKETKISATDYERHLKCPLTGIQKNARTKNGSMLQKDTKYKTLSHSAVHLWANI